MRKLRWNRVCMALSIPVLSVTLLVESFKSDAEAESPQVFEEVIMWEGGTLWQVAEKYGKSNDHSDVRDVLYHDVFIEVKGEKVPYANFNPTSLRPGMTIYVERH